MAWVEAFIPAEEKHRDEVYAATWGHLAPHRNRTYQGRIVFAVGAYDSLNPVVLACEFNGLPDSPWFYQAFMELVEQTRGDEEAGRVYEWTGTFRNYKFKGKQRLLLDVTASS